MRGVDSRSTVDRPPLPPPVANGLNGLVVTSSRLLVLTSTPDVVVSRVGRIPREWGGEIFSVCVSGTGVLVVSGSTDVLKFAVTSTPLNVGLDD